MAGKTTLKVRGLCVRHSNIYCVTAENYERYRELSRQNRIWNGRMEVDEDYEYEAVIPVEDPRIRIYLRQVESLSLDKKDKSLSTLLVKFRETYKPNDLLRALKNQDQIPLEDCLDFLPKTYESSKTVYSKTLRIKFEAGHWLRGAKDTYVSARSIYAAYRAWLDVIPHFTSRIYLLNLVAGKTSYLTRYQKSLLKEYRQPRKRKTLSLCEYNCLINMWCHAIMNEAGQHELAELREDELIRQSSYVYNPVQPAPITTVNKRLSQLRLPRQ